MKNDKFFLFFVFITGASIMALEMAAFNATVPYFGGSVFIWSIIIGTIMIALSGGYYLGGRIADKYPRTKVLFFIIAFSAFFIGFIPLAQKIIFETLRSLFRYSIYSSFGYVVMLFSFPVFLLGMTSPFVARLYNKNVNTTGSITGLVYAFSTIGSVFGIYIASFYLLPAFGTRTTILIISIALTSLCAFGWIKKTCSLIKTIPVFLILLALPFLFHFLASVGGKGIIYEKESFYGTIQVKQMNDEERIILDINSSGRWSVYHPENVLTGMYFDYFIPLYHLLENKEDIEILIIGHAGGVFSRQYSHFWGEKGIQIDGLEIDPEVTKAARMFFDIDSHDGLTVINEDGRIFLNKTEKKYDLIFADAYTGALYIPFHLATKEFFTLVDSKLKEGGIFAQHVIGNYEKEHIPQCIGDTINSVFLNTYFLDTTKGENIIIGSKKDLFEKISSLQFKEGYLETKHLREKISNNFFPIKREISCLFTDNRAPTDLIREGDVFFRSSF